VSDDPDELVTRVDHGDGKEVVLVDLAGDRFLVLVDPADDRVALHDLVDPGARAGHDQAFERDDAEELVLGVNDEAVVDRLAVGGFVAEPVEGLADGQVRGKGGVVGRHDRAGGSLFEAGEAADVLAFGLGEVAKDLIDAIFVEPVDEVSAVVVRHQVQERRGLDGGHRVDDADLPLGVDVAHDRRLEPVGEDGEDRVPLVLVHVFDHLGDVRRVLLGEEVAEGGDLARLDQLPEVGHEQRISQHQPGSGERGRGGRRRENAMSTGRGDA